MLVNKVFYYGIEILMVIFAVCLLCCYFDGFFSRKKRSVLSIINIMLFIIWQIEMFSFNLFPAIVNICITVGICLFVVIHLYEGEFWNKCIFTIVYNAIGMLMETLSYFMMMIFFEEYANSKLLGSLLSKVLFLILILALKKIFSKEEIRKLPIQYSVMLILIPTGSIYIMNNIFMLSMGGYRDSIRWRSLVTALILLGINVLIFYLYLKLVDVLQLRRMTLVYEQQLDLCEMYQKERELSALEIRDMRHNIKSTLISILAYAENGDTKKIADYISEILESNGVKSESISNSGNIVIDSLIDYWATVSEKDGIEYSVNISVPMEMSFKGADVCLILGNLLENAVEAARKAEGKKQIRIQIKYDRNNLLVFVENTYNGNIIKLNDNQLKSTKEDVENHGVGLPSVYRAVSKYQGTVAIEDSVSGWFRVRVVLYGK